MTLAVGNVSYAVHRGVRLPADLRLQPRGAHGQAASGSPGERSHEASHPFPADPLLVLRLLRAPVRGGHHRLPRSTAASTSASTSRAASRCSSRWRRPASRSATRARAAATISIPAGEQALTAAGDFIISVTARRTGRKTDTPFRWADYPTVTAFTEALAAGARRRDRDQGRRRRRPPWSSCRSCARQPSATRRTRST